MAVFPIKGPSECTIPLTGTPLHVSYVGTRAVPLPGDIVVVMASAWDLDGHAVDLGFPQDAPFRGRMGHGEFLPHLETAIAIAECKKPMLFTAPTLSECLALDSMQPAGAPGFLVSLIIINEEPSIHNPATLTRVNPARAVGFLDEEAVAVVGHDILVFDGMAAALIAKIARTWVPPASLVTMGSQEDGLSAGDILEFLEDLHREGVIHTRRTS